jgi:ABC-type antimicrobial peptide transport system permease subunit
VLSLLLAVVGLYGVAAHAARQRRRDLAVRMALGARRAAVEALFVREAAATVAVGLAAGAFGGRALRSALSGQLHGVRPGDAATWLAVAALVVATALLAVWLPARRAARIDVTEVLREE